MSAPNPEPVDNAPLRGPPFCGTNVPRPLPANRLYLPRRPCRIGLMIPYQMRTWTRAKALRSRELSLSCIHRLIEVDEKEPLRRELDQLAIDGHVEMLWAIAERWGLTPHICMDRYCYCHVVILEGQPAGGRSLPTLW